MFPSDAPSGRVQNKHSDCPKNLKQIICGFDRFCVTRVDRKPFSSRELKKIERLITNDLRFDYTEEELDIFFDYDEEAGDAFLVTVQDREGLET